MTEVIYPSQISSEIASYFCKKGKNPNVNLKFLSIMKIMFLLIILSLVVAMGFLLAFIWATKSGQFDDDYTPSVRMLFDDDTAKKP